jgi:hypothetical protein
MSKTLLISAGVSAEPAKTADFQLEPMLRSTAMYGAQNRYAQEMQRERLRQAEAQRLRRAAWRARRSLAARLMCL